MRKTNPTLFALIITMLALSVSWTVKDAWARIQLPPAENIKASGQQVKEIISFFDDLEKAIIREDLDEVMTFYADNYFHRGINKDQVRSIWADIFKKYDILNSVHAFTDIKVVPDEAGLDEGLVVCTGTLMGVPAGSKNMKSVTIDSWTKQNHYIYRVKGSWKIVGGSSHRMMGDKPPAGKRVERPLGFHPLY